MSKMVELKLYSPLQVDVIDRDRSDHAVPLQAVDRERAGEYLGRIMNGNSSPRRTLGTPSPPPSRTGLRCAKRSFPSPVRWN